MFIRLVKGHSYAVRATRQDGLPRQLHYGPASEEEMRAVKRARLEARRARERGGCLHDKITAVDRELTKRWRAVDQAVATALAERGFHLEKGQWRKRREFKRPRSRARQAEAR